MEGFCEVVPGLQLRRQYCLFEGEHHTLSHVLKVRTSEACLKAREGKYGLRKYVLQLGDVITSQGEK